WQLVLYFLRLGTFGFGGPVALVGYMYRDLVEERGWITDTDYNVGMALAQLAPGPLAAQLGIYMGFVHYRLLGATLVGIVFVLPSFLMVVALGWAYVNYGGLAWMQAVFYGVGAAVAGIIAMSAYKLTRKTIAEDKLLWVVYLALAVTTVILESEPVWLVLAAGILVCVARVRPRLGGGGLAAVAPLSLPPSATVVAADPGILPQVALLFIKGDAFVFGSGLAIVPFLYGETVTELQWLTESQFIDAVAVAMITPGPVVIIVGFIGYLVAGLPGAIVASVATFLPCYLLTIIPAPYFKKHGKRPGLAAFVDGVTAAAIGAITGAVIVIAQCSITDVPTTLLALATVALLWKFKKLQEPVIVLVAALIGLVLYPMVV
ncbi:MAG: chromate transporter, partial [Nitrococcus sp.]|nr:chromate transporter [Nitrococcus sp.]